jgi:hypothetical protein
MQRTAGGYSCSLFHGAPIPKVVSRCSSEYPNQPLLFLFQTIQKSVLEHSSRLSASREFLAPSLRLGNLSDDSQARIPDMEATHPARPVNPGSTARSYPYNHPLSARRCRRDIRRIFRTLNLLVDWRWLSAGPRASYRLPVAGALLSATGWLSGGISQSRIGRFSVVPEIRFCRPYRCELA